MKLPFFIIFTFCVSAVLSAQDIPPFYTNYQQFLDLYLKNGLIDYPEAKKNLSRIKDLDSIFRNEIYTQNIAEAKTDLVLNTYNLSVILKILEYYPINSVQQIPSFFKEKSIHFADASLSLDDLESFIINKRQHPDLHLVLNCGAISCPDLWHEVFVPNDFEGQVKEVVTKALENDLVFNIDEQNQVLYLSKIFDWCEKDFQFCGGIVPFLMEYHIISEESNPEQYRIEFIPYDWRLNATLAISDQQKIRYSAGQLLPKGKTEIKLFNALYTQQNHISPGNIFSRSTYFSTYAQYAFGIHEHYNMGIDLVYKSNRLHDLPGNSPFLSLKPVNQDTLFRDGKGVPIITGYGGQSEVTLYRSGLSHFGPKIKLNPLKKVKGLTLQQTLYVPVQKNIDPSWVSFTQFFYDRMIGTNQQIFVELSFWFTLSPDFRLAPFPKVFYSYFPKNKWTIYTTTTGLYEWGAGTKYYINPQLELELLYTHYLPLEWIQPGRRANTFNFGIRYSNNN